MAAVSNRESVYIPEKGGNGSWYTRPYRRSRSVCPPVSRSPRVCPTVEPRQTEITNDSQVVVCGLCLRNFQIRYELVNTGQVWRRGARPLTCTRSYYVVVRTRAPPPTRCAAGLA